MKNEFKKNLNENQFNEKCFQYLVGNSFLINIQKQLNIRRG